jgi:hypothetical protein
LRLLLPLPVVLRRLLAAFLLAFRLLLRLHAILITVHPDRLSRRRAAKEKCPHLLGTGIVWACHKAFSDGLPYEKRADGKGEPVCIAEEVPFELPKGWAWARIASIANEPMYGTSRKSEAAGKMPVLRMGNITRVGTINYDDLAYTSFDSDVQKFALQAGDVVSAGRL